MRPGSGLKRRQAQPSVSVTQSHVPTVVLIMSADNLRIKDRYTVRVQFMIRKTGGDKTRGWVEGGGVLERMGEGGGEGDEEEGGEWGTGGGGGEAGEGKEEDGDEGAGRTSSSVA